MKDITKWHVFPVDRCEEYSSKIRYGTNIPLAANTGYEIANLYTKTVIIH
jgi:hypothetical protein